MTVFVWTPVGANLDEMSEAQLNTELVKPDAICLLCGNALLPNQRVMTWHAHTKLHFHAACVRDNARGLLKDISECLR